MTKSFALRTPRTPEKPRSLRAFWTLSPSGSVTPFFRCTSTRTRTIRSPAHGMGATLLGLSRHVPGQVRPERLKGRGRADDHIAAIEGFLREAVCDELAERRAGLPHPETA